MLTISKKQWLIFLVIIILSVQGFSQNQEYSIFWGDDQIGSLFVSKKSNGAKVDYNFKADVEFRVILKYIRETEVKASFVNDTLEFCSSKSIMNDDIKEYFTSRRIGNSYEIFEYPSDTYFFEGIIKHTVAKLYFEEPTSLRETYAEGHSKFCKIEKLESGSYKLHLSDDKTNIYKYVNGRLEEVQVNRTWFDLVFKRIE